MRVLSLTFSILLAAACGGGDDGNQVGADADPSAPDADPSAPDGAPGQWEALITGDWEMPAGTEGYRCARKTVTETMYITSFRAISPNGTHHTVLTVGEPSGSDGVSDCNAGTNADAMIYGSGVGTNEFHMPDGVAMKVEAGQQLLLNLHLFNVTDNALDEISGTEVITIPEEEVVHVAEAILMGPTFTLSVPPGESTQTGQCTMNGDVTFFAVGPHMHQLGTHMKVVADSSIEGETVIHDGPYSFYEQKLYPMDEQIEMADGDVLEVECSYDNDTGSSVSFGDSSTQEMCFATMYRYPAHGADFGGIICSI